MKGEINKFRRYRRSPFETRTDRNRDGCYALETRRKSAIRKMTVNKLFKTIYTTHSRRIPIMHISKSCFMCFRRCSASYVNNDKFFELYPKKINGIKLNKIAQTAFLPSALTYWFAPAIFVIIIVVVLRQLSRFFLLCPFFSSSNYQSPERRLTIHQKHLCFQRVKKAVSHYSSSPQSSVLSPLHDRHFLVKFHNEQQTSHRHINSDLPHVIVLGLLLLKRGTSTTAIFDDDTAVLTSHEDPHIASQQLQKNLNRIQIWRK